MVDKCQGKEIKIVIILGEKILKFKIYLVMILSSVATENIESKLFRCAKIKCSIILIRNC